MHQPSLVFRLYRSSVSVGLAVAACGVAAFMLRDSVPGLRPALEGEPQSLHVVSEMLLAVSCVVLAATFISVYDKCKGLLSYRGVLLVFALLITASGVTRVLGLLELSDRNFSLSAEFEIASAALAAVSTGIVAALVGRMRRFLVTARQSQRSEARFLAASESSLEAFYTLEAVRGKDGQIDDFKFTYLNSNGEKLIGLPREDVIGQYLCTLVPVNRTGGFFDEYKQVVMTGEPVVQEFPMRLENDIPRWIRHEVVRLEDGIAISASDITERKMMERATQHRAQHDPLTGLPNRSLLNDRVQQAIDRAIRYRSRIGLFVVDLDRFKQINDTLGHAAGDLVLVTAAQRMRDSVRGTDSVLRIGGDEFIIVMPDVHEEKDIRRLAAKINAAIAQDGPHGLLEVEMSCSIGIAIYPTQADTAEELFSLADAAMYQAKHRGGGCFEVYSEATPEFPQHFVPVPRRETVTRTAVVVSATQASSSAAADRRNSF